MILKGAIRKEGEGVKRLTVACLNITLLDLKEVREVKEVEVKRKRERGEVIVVKGNRDITVQISKSG